MKYEEKLFKIINNPDGYLWWEDCYPHSTLNSIAEEALINDTIEGKTTTLFIYHQLNQEILNLLVRYCDLVVRASLYPVKASEELQKDNLDFGVALKKLQASIEFKNKSKIISKSQELNKLRNGFAHEIVKKHFSNALENELTNIRDKFESIFKDWQECMSWFYQEIERLKKRPEIRSEMAKYKPAHNKALK